MWGHDFKTRIYASSSIPEIPYPESSVLWLFLNCHCGQSHARADIEMAIWDWKTSKLFISSFRTEKTWVIEVRRTKLPKNKKLQRNCAVCATRKKNEVELLFALEQEDTAEGLPWLFEGGRNFGWHFYQRKEWTPRKGKAGANSFLWHWTGHRK